MLCCCKQRFEISSANDNSGYSWVSSSQSMEAQWILFISLEIQPFFQWPSPPPTRLVNFGSIHRVKSSRAWRGVIAPSPEAIHVISGTILSPWGPLNYEKVSGLRNANSAGWIKHSRLQFPESSPLLTTQVFIFESDSGLAWPHLVRWFVRPSLMPLRPSSL